MRKQQQIVGVEGEIAAVWESVTGLKPWPKNPRKITDRDVAKVAASIKRFGFAAPLIVQRATDEVIAGHTRLRAAVLNGMAFVPVRRMDLNDAEAHALALADNKLNELARWDDIVLADVLKTVNITEALGFNDVELKNLLAGDVPVLSSDDVLPTPPKRPTSKTGDVYILGNHRLSCGDFRTKEFWDGVLADLIWTDPPYGIDVASGSRALSVEERKAKGGKQIESDGIDDAALARLLRDAFVMMSARSKPGAVFYVASPSQASQFYVFATALKELGIWRHTLAWVKQSLVMGRCDYHYRHESIFYGWKPDGAHYWAGARNLDSILEFDRPSKSPDHPTIKPSELVQHCIENSSMHGELVADPFLGSGTTIVAAERTERRAIGTEMNLGYCDVIVERWKQLTGGSPELSAGSPSLKGKKRTGKAAAA